MFWLLLCVFFSCKKVGDKDISSASALRSKDKCTSCKSNHSIKHITYEDADNSFPYESSDVTTFANGNLTHTANQSDAPVAAFRKRKNSKRGTNNYIFVSIGNTPSTLSKHNSTREPSSKSNTLQSVTTGSLSTPISSPKLSSLSSKSVGFGTSNVPTPVGINPSSSACSPIITRAPDGMRLRIFLPPVRYPSIPTVCPPDEFSSQGSDRDYQNGVDDVNPQTTSTSTTSTSVAATTTTYANTTDNGKLITSNPTTNIEDTSNSTSAVNKDSKDEPDSKHTNGFYESPPEQINTDAVMGRCKALYDYDANMYDELTIRTGK